MLKVILPHELAHQVDWDINKKDGHGPTWKSIMVNYGLPPDRLHNLVNTKWEARKAAIK
jgi:predicted SprT family Zn-dependent metalloprotease